MYNYLINKYALKAIDFFHSMIEKDIIIDNLTIINTIKACSQIGDV